MTDSQGSGQSQLSPMVVLRSNRVSMGKNPKKSLVHANIFSLRDMLFEFSKCFPNMMHLEAYNYPSKYSQDKVDTIAKLFDIITPRRAIKPGAI